MFWIILTLMLVGCAVLLGYLSGKYKYETLTVIFAVVSFITVIVLTATGISDLPYLEGKRAYVVSLKSEIETIRNVRYKDVKSGEAIGGSLDNMQQSKTLSEYIKYYAQEKANYNNYLTKCRIHLNNPVFFWFGDAFAMSNKILSLKEL